MNPTDLKLLNYSQDELIGVAQSYVTAIEQGQGVPWENLNFVCAKVIGRIFNQCYSCRERAKNELKEFIKEWQEKK